MKTGQRHNMGQGGNCICPKCGAKMLREGSYRRQLLKTNGTK